MNRCLTLILVFGSCLVGQTVQDFTRLYDAYLAAVKSGSFAKVTALGSRGFRDQLRDPDEQKRFMTIAQLMAPASYETLFLTMSNGGQKAELQVVTTIQVPEDVQKEQKLPPTQRLELILTFLKEGGQWKWDGPTILGDPDKRARPKDLKMGARSDYQEGSDTQMGGQILRLEKQAEGTVYVIRVLDEEIAAFVPAANVSAEFVTGRVLMLRGAAHKSEKLKFWADEASLQKQ